MHTSTYTLIALAVIGCSGEPQSNSGSDRGSIESNTSADPVVSATMPATGVFATPYGPMELPYSVVDGKNVVGGDIVMGPDLSGPQARSGVISTSTSRWPQGIVYYEVDPALSPDVNRPTGDPEFSQGDRVSNAIAKWQAASPIRFIPSSTAANRIRFTRSSGCNSPIGMVGGTQIININDTCFQRGVVHEIGHSLGLFHEQQRSDRDNFISVAHCVDGDSNYAKQSVNVETNLGPFDFNSIMLYDGCFNCPGTSQPLMINRSTGLCFNQPASISAGDIAGINYLYGTLHATDIGAPGRSFATSGGVLYGVQPDGNGIWKYSGGVWTNIDATPNTLGVFAGGTKVYKTDGNRQTYIYNGGSSWTTIQLPGVDLIGHAVDSNGTLYAFTNATQTTPATSIFVYRYSGSGTSWANLGNGGSGTTRLYAGGDKVFKVNFDQNIYRYDGGTVWTQVGATGGGFVVDRQGRLYGIEPRGTGIWAYSGSGTSWTKIGMDSNGLFAADNTIYNIDQSNRVQRYSGSPQSWTFINGPASKVYASGSLVAAAALTSGEIFSYAP